MLDIAFSFEYVHFLNLLEMDAGIVGLCLSYAVLLTGQFQWCVRQSAEVENQVSLFL